MSFSRSPKRVLMPPVCDVANRVCGYTDRVPRKYATVKGHTVVSLLLAQTHASLNFTGHSICGD